MSQRVEEKLTAEFIENHVDALLTICEIPQDMESLFLEPWVVVYQETALSEL